MASGTQSEPQYGEAQTPLADRPYQPTTVPAVQDPPGSTPLAYLRSQHGLLKIAQVVTSFIAFICVEVVDRCRNCKALYFFEFVSCSVFLITLSLFIIFCCKLDKRFSAINWKLTDSINTLLATLFLFIACIILAAKNSGHSAEIAAVTMYVPAILPWLLLALKQAYPLHTQNETSFEAFLAKLVSRQARGESIGNAGQPKVRQRRYLRESDQFSLLRIHNKLRGQVSPSASNMEYMGGG
uniref:MARVEL domain-containing protein n=1 Tax=Eptatretus burgeri TaxID=7764 RepID=A0A8C4QT92_EPTBU